MMTLVEVLEEIPESGLRSDRDQRPEEITAFMVRVEKFAEAGRLFKKAGARLAAEWASDESGSGRGFSVHALYTRGSEYIIVRSRLARGEVAFPGLSKKFISASRFERTIKSLMGLRPAGLLDNRPWIKHEDWPEDAYPLRKSFDAGKKMPRIDGNYAFIEASGEGVYEIPVGPVHAGIIEPGHFRFQAVGEDILNLEERLGYVHKGIEKRFEALSWEEGARLAGRVSGDSTVAHATAYCRAVEAASGVRAPERADWIRALMLERERIANHLGDIGAICNDAAFAFFNYQFSRLREYILRTNYEVFGHRLMMDRIVPGGVSVDIDSGTIALITEEIISIVPEFERLVEIYVDNPSLGNRVSGAGVLSEDKARALGCVGVVARASNIALDARLSRPYPPYDRLVPKIVTADSGDVHGRVMVRIGEVRESIRLIGRMLEEMPAGDIKRPFSAPKPGEKGLSIVEGWRGEIVYSVETGPDGKINRCMVRDPSAVNWLGLESAIKGNLVPDFPLCNKSFNQSYSGHDL